MAEETYELIYWPMLQGRGEFPRLLFADAGVAYTDVARASPEAGGGVPAVLSLKGKNPGNGGIPSFVSGSH